LQPLKAGAFYDRQGKPIVASRFLPHQDRLRST
jgi:hypothetical protein